MKALKTLLRLPLLKKGRPLGLIQGGFPDAQADRQSLLANELHHRLQNTLSVVLALARITGRSVDTMAEFQAAFGARIQALARTNSLLLRGHAQSVDVPGVLELELEPYLGVGQITLDCEPLGVRPEAALSLSLIIHELATNAVKYGGLSGPQGTLAVRCERRGEGAVLVWTETFPDRAEKAVPKKGAGSVLIERLAYDLGGTAALEFAATGLTATITFRLETETFAVDRTAAFHPAAESSSPDATL
jgi:two-component sensor histidine kinase